MPTELELALTEAEADFAAAQVQTREAVSSLGAAEASVGRLLTLLRASQGGGGGGGEVGGPAIYHDTGWASASLNQNLGWQFTVGDNDINVAALRLYNEAESDLTETVTIYQASDGAVVASGQVTANGGWGQTEITPVTLSSGTDYVVSRYQGGASRTVHRAPSTVAFDPAVTLVGYRVGSDGDMPASSTSTSYASAAFATAAPEAGYRFYRLNFVSNNGGGTVIGTNELGLREEVSGSSVAPGQGKGTASDDVSGLNPPTAAAFDGTTGTSGWFDTSGNAVNTKWLMFDFGSSNEREVVEYSVGAYPTSSSTAARSPNSWKFVASNDLQTWDELDVVSGEAGWSLGETRVFTL